MPRRFIRVDPGRVPVGVLAEMLNLDCGAAAVRLMVETPGHPRVELSRGCVTLICDDTDTYPEFGHERLPDGARCGSTCRALASDFEYECSLAPGHLGPHQGYVDHYAVERQPVEWEEVPEDLCDLAGSQVWRGDQLQFPLDGEWRRAFATGFTATDEGPAVTLDNGLAPVPLSRVVHVSPSDPIRPCAAWVGREVAYVDGQRGRVSDMSEDFVYALVAWSNGSTGPAPAAELALLPETPR